MSTPTKPRRDEPVATFEHNPAAEPRPDWALSDERVPVFQYTDEDEVVQSVTMPARPNPGLALNFLRKGRTIGAELAISWLIEEAIGEDGYDTLVAQLSKMDNPESGQAVMQAIAERVQGIVMGGLEGPKA